MNQPYACSSRNIPLPIKREVRQRCGFGCVVCDLPLYEYEHMEEWAVVQRHVSDEITLLCNQHHGEKTRGLLPKKEVKRANANPYNLREGVSKPYALHFSGDEATVEIGGNRFTTGNNGRPFSMLPLVIDNTPIIAFSMEGNHLFLTLQVFDSFNRLLLQIIENQLVYSIIPWDIELVARNLKLREAHREILIEIEFLPPNKISVNRGRFLLNGVELLVRNNRVLLVNNANIISGCEGRGAATGLALGEYSLGLPSIFTMGTIERYKVDRERALKFEKEYNI
ncbi:MAG: hypothetical protein ACFCUR_00140 [Rhodomicrobiaceae bacterium]